jgi:DNA-binding ferritin-like protein
MSAVSVQQQLFTNSAVIESLPKMVEQWKIQYSEMSVLLVLLKHAYSVHQHHHWIASKGSYYGDHLLYKRLYEEIDPEIDGVAEKAIGLNNVQNVDLLLQTHQQLHLVKLFGASTGVNTDDLVRRSLCVEYTLVSSIDVLKESLDNKYMTTYGLDNMLAGISDLHERHIYLLKQRS